MDNGTYSMTMSLNVLRHLGTGLYSNIPAVISEAVANAWDADASNVDINVDFENGRITITDDGYGMDIDDANSKYLLIGYDCRKDRRKTEKGRVVMGRKGIGNLSLFSIADTVTVYSVRNNQSHGFCMNVPEIEKRLKEGTQVYNPSPVKPDAAMTRGTKIVLSDLKQRGYKHVSLRKRLARRFSIIGARYKFEITVNGEPITADDRGYQKRLQYAWIFGDAGRDELAGSDAPEMTNLSPDVCVDGTSERIDGWIGTARGSGLMTDTDSDENMNRVVIMARGKLAQEDILETFGEGGMYSKYVMGVIHADFLDKDDCDDIATTSRQQIIEDDPRYVALREKLRADLKTIRSQWSEWRNAGGESAALEIPEIKTWYGDLPPDLRSAAKKLFGRINEHVIHDENRRRELFIGGILAFENLRLRDMAHRIKEIDVDDLDAFRRLFGQLDDMEATAYYQTTKNRLLVIDKLINHVDERENVIQRHIFDHLWLLDPSWERVGGTEYMEKTIMKALETDAGLSDEQKRMRLDIKYMTTGNKHVVIELKRPNATINHVDLYFQITKYRQAISAALKNANRNEPLEIVCVLGRRPSDMDPSEQERERKSLMAFDARIVTYDELINNAQAAYSDYLNKQEKVSRVYRLITSITDDDVESLRPS